jgi:hypothetical protein
VERAWSATSRSEVRPDEAERAALAWASSAEPALAEVLAATVEPEGPGRAARRALARAERRVAAGRRALGDEGLVALGLAAAAGLEAAERMLVDLLGVRGRRLVVLLRDRLAQEAAGQADREAAAVAAVLDRPELAPDAASTLRLRLAVIKGLT